MLFKPFKAFLLLVLLSCNNNNVKSFVVKKAAADTIPAPLKNIADIPLPAGYARTQPDINSFAAWLLQVHLKKGHTVYLFNGEKKINQSAQFAILDISVGTKDLQQCADAVMRLRAEYLFAQKKFSMISFSDNAGVNYTFSAPYSRAHFDAYLQTVFGMCGSASLAKQLKPATMPGITAGDVLIRGGFPGHAVLVMDVASNEKGKKIYLLAQSYMPAQDIHVLNNPANQSLSPWYEVNENERIVTPEYIFSKTELKTW